MSGGQSRSQAEAKRWSDASADDPVENRRGRPRTRLDHPSDLLDRVKTGGEIRSYIRKKNNNVPVRYLKALFKWKSDQLPIESGNQHKR